MIAFCCSSSITAQEERDSLPQATSSQINLSILNNDSTEILVPHQLMVQDSTLTDSTQSKDGALKYNILQSAEDQIIHDFKTHKTYMYNQAKISYGDMSLEAGVIVLDNQTHMVFAKGLVVDSTGEYTQSPVFTQGNRKVNPDSLRFNFKTKKALVYNSRTKEGEFKVKAETTKRINDSVYYMRDVTFTTSEDVDNPEYYFLAQKVKFVPGKEVITGFVNMWIADVPTPLALPFGYFPMSDTRTSGFIIPSFGNVNDRGFSLQDGGYYFAINDYLDLTVLGDYYTNGSYGLRLESNYAKRYHYRGNFSFRYEKLLNGFRGFPGFTESSIYNIRWRHEQDPKASPNSRFSAHVNLGSSKYYRQSINENNTGNFLNNNLSSSVSYSKTFPGDPEFRFSVTATHNQNTNTEEINMTLPTFDASISRVYPFAPKNGIKKGIIENINLRYSIQGENRFRTSDSLFFTSEMFNKAKTGIQQRIPLSTNFKLFNYFSVSLGGTYEENWLFKTYGKSYNPTTEEVIVDTTSGFDSYRTYNFNASVGTTVYGIFKFNEKNKIQAIRHVIKPSLSYSVTPSFEKFYDTYLIPATSGAPQEIVEYSRFENTLFGAPNRNFASSLGFSVTNDFEAKIRNDEDPDGEPIKRELLSNLRFSTSYNFAADSLKLRPLTFSGTLPIIQDKFSINFNGALDPYALNSQNQRIDKLNIENGGSLFRLTRANISFGYSFSSEDFNKDDEDDKEDEDVNETFRNGGRRDDLFGAPMNPDGTFGNEEKDKAPVKNETKRYNYKIPWNFRVAYTMTYNNLHRENEISSHSIMFSGNVELSPRWKVGVSSGYDMKNQGFTYTQFRFQRDLKSWRFSFNWIPFGIRESWYFYIGIKANILKSIKLDKRQSYRQF